MADTLESRIDACSRALLARCIELDLPLTGDGRVCEEHAARLLCVAPGSLKAMRHEGKGPPAYGRGMNGSRLSYRIGDLAAWIEAGRLDW